MLCDSNENSTEIIVTGHKSDKQTFYARMKPMFDEILKQVESNAEIADSVQEKFQEIINFTKTHNNSTNSNDMVDKNNNVNEIVSYNDKIDSRFRAKRFKYGWEK